MAFSRREFVQGLAVAWLGAALACRRAEEATGGAPRSGRALTTLTPDQATELEAITARIIPTDESPGAREAGVIWFIDASLSDWASDQRALIEDGLSELGQEVARAHPGQTRFSALSEAEQDALLVQIEQSDFFESVRFATLAGMFALPKYGGNADFIGWNLVGQENVHEFTPPFGWYDHPDNQRALLGRVL